MVYVAIMSTSIGVFHEGEIDGKQFHIFTFPSQTHIPTSSSGEAAIDSGGDNNTLSLTQPLFLCPSTRHKVEMLKRKEDGYSSDDVLPFNTSAHFANVRSTSDQIVKHLFDPDNDSGICKLPLAPLFWCNDKNPLDKCNACRRIGGTSYYLCPTCGKIFHKQCVEAPLEIKHPSYPFLSLQLYSSPTNINNLWMCYSCEGWIFDFLVYHSPTYNLKMHPFCAMNPIPILIDQPKRHLHSLAFFPKQNFLPCNVCGLIEKLIPTYVCVPCGFVVHRECIYFPYVIRISRHQHRISVTYSLPSGNLSCGVCRKKVDNDCGAYSCNKCADYFVHSRCALRTDLWDGEELDEVPEEPEIVVEPFKIVSDGIILHFSHGHNLKLQISRVYDDGKFCQACVLPIYEGNYYSCVDHCDFILHEACAYAPRKKHHPLNAYSLTLKVVSSQYNDNTGQFCCDACQRKSCGFVYEGPPGPECFRLDVRCASISEPFKYEGHEHPLYLSLTPEEEISAIYVKSAKIVVIVTIGVES